MDTFPIIKKEDEAQFAGRYFRKEMIIAYMRALNAGDTESRITL